MQTFAAMEPCWQIEGAKFVANPLQVIQVDQKRHKKQWLDNLNSDALPKGHGYSDLAVGAAGVPQWQHPAIGCSGEASHVGEVQGSHIGMLGMLLMFTAIPGRKMRSVDPERIFWFLEVQQKLQVWEIGPSDHMECFLRFQFTVYFFWKIDHPLDSRCGNQLGAELFSRLHQEEWS